ncbi:malate:quinone oxidoreductase [Oleiphilus messinensis]|uniref:Probable malate:quinone oxidoreductase n=1 Tax=Oleiphilus messinensis TaxID=141451 RepID=A0A1Y0IE50_9GAMM|nr:malate:quinone oxidoreductase [Oleiphilus messinensis]ARU58449.1 malate:quinone oxidoreductase [Oleiphilus messinensis]
MKVVVVGAGVMGVTFATIAKALAPDLDISIIERLPKAAGSNSSVFNNAGTGHEANCELNYTPVDEEIISVEKALKIHAQFNVAKQFWAYLVQQGIIKDPATFIHQTKHCTLVSQSSINELRLRFKEMSAHHFFDHMHYSEDFEEIKRWIPLTMENRPASEQMAATMIESGTDVNFESVTEQMADYLVEQAGVDIHYRTHVRHVHRSPSGGWWLETQSEGQAKRYKADILFVGAGGGAFPLLKRSHLPFRSRFAGFPVGGRFLLTPIDEDMAKHYGAKTYGKAKVGAPPMSVPHLDLRAANGQHYLLFGPFATFMPILEKNRGMFEYIRSMRLHDIPNLMNVAVEHFPLVKYLLTETFKGKNSMLSELESFAPGLSTKFDWQVIQAGQRVQIIKDGDLQMGTEIVVSEDLSYGTLLGASPGASVSPEVMLRCLEKMMPGLFETEAAQQVMNEMFPVSSLDQLMNDAECYRTVRDNVNQKLGIKMS